VMGIFLAFEGVVKGFELIKLGEVFADMEEFLDEGVIVVVVSEVPAAEFFDGAEHFDDEDAMMSNDSSAAFADDIGVGDVFALADIREVIDDVVGIFLEGIIGGAFEVGAAAIVVDSESAADIEVMEGEPHFVKFGVEAGGFLDGFFDGEDIGDLGADMEMEELECLGEVFRLEEFGCGDEFGGAESELGVFTSTFGPFPGAFAEEADTDANDGGDGEVLGDSDDLSKLFELFDDHNDGFAEFDAEQRHFDEAGVLVAVADDEAAGFTLLGEGGEEFGFAADFEAEVEGLPGVEDFFDDFAELVDFDGEDAAVMALVIEFGDGVLEGFVDGSDPVAEDVLEPDQEGEFEASGFGFFDDVGDFD